MEPNSQLSYAVVYNAADAESLAFNQNTVSGAHQEKPTFLSLPIKRNSLAMKTATLSKLTTGVKDFIVKSFNRSEKPIEVKPTNGIVDFKATLLPIICHLTPEDLKLSNALAAMELDGSIKRFLNHVELMLPSDSQWSNLNSLRIHAGSPDRSSEGVEKIAEYYAQLLNMEQNFSFQNETVVIEFEWTEAFSPESRFVTRCIHYEKAAVLFNLAAIFSHLGASQRLWAPKGKQNAADYFKRAAGVLLHVRDTLSNQVPSGFNPTNDLHEQSLTAFSSLMLAQAMECYYEKSIEDQASSDLISKIAVQCADFYAVSTRNLKSHLSVIESRCQKQWLYQSKAKWRLYSAIAHFHARTTLPAEKAVAERVCRLTLAKDLVIKAHNHALKVGRELEDLVKSHYKAIMDAYSIIEHANTDNFQQNIIDEKLLYPLERPSQAIVNPIPLFQSIKMPEEFETTFHLLVAPKNRNDFLKLLNEYETFMRNGSAGLKMSLRDLERISERQQHLSASLNGSAGIKDTISHNQANGGKLVDQLTKLQMDENVIKSEDMIKGLEFALNNMSIDDQKRVRELRADFDKVKVMYATKCSDFSPLDWTKEKLTEVMPYGVFETVDVDKLCNKVGSVDAIKLRDKCHSTIASIKEFEINLEKPFVECGNWSAYVEKQRSLLYKVKAESATILKEKNEILLEVEQWLKLIDEQGKAQLIITEFTKSINQISAVRNRAASIVEEIRDMKGVPVKSDNDRSRDVKSALAAFGFNHAENSRINLARWKSTVDLKVVDKWQSNLASPELKHFQVICETDDEFELAPMPGTIDNTNLLSPFNKSAKDLLPATAKSNAVQNESSPEVLKMQLLRENAILKDKSLLLTKRVADPKTFDRNDSATSQNGSIAESAEPVFTQDAPVHRTNAGIQEWIQTQQRKATSKSRATGFGKEIEPAVIYMASMAAAAATSAGLTSVNKSSRVKDEESLSSKTAVKSPRAIRKLSKGGKRHSFVREDSGIGATQSASDTDYKVAETNLRQLREMMGREKMNQSLGRMKRENKRMAELLSGSSNN